MSVELAYIAEMCVKVLEHLDDQFYPVVIKLQEKAEDPKATARRKKMAIEGTRIMAFSPLLGRNPAIQNALSMSRELLGKAKNLSDPSIIQQAVTFLNVFRGFLQVLSSISEDGVRRHPEIFHLFRQLSKGCIGRGKPAKASSDAKKSWSDFFQAKDQARKPKDHADCKTLHSSLQALKKEVEGRLDQILESERSDAENVISAVENILVACESCIFGKDAPST